MDIPRPTPLVRQTNAYWGLSQWDRLRWDAAKTLDEREAIVQQHRTRHGLDGKTLAADQGVVQVAAENNRFGLFDQVLLLRELMDTRS